MNSSPKHMEIERKYLIRYPDTKVLLRQEGVRVLRIRQTYLVSPPGCMRRVRRIEENGEIRFIRTEKRHVSLMSAWEDERKISAVEYEKELLSADPGKRPIEKTRYVIPHGAYFCEIDVYPFWQDRAILEIELPSEEVVPELPGYVALIRDVSEDGRYKNGRLAREIPADSLED